MVFREEGVDKRRWWNYASSSVLVVHLRRSAAKINQESSVEHLPRIMALE